MTRDETANLLDGIIDKELGDLDIPSISDYFLSIFLHEPY
ncbi:hypothetical protein SAMN05421832_11597 [Psychrobacillus psychrodurans]|nr:hypothetical protein SAMN05421832_11597 [Psychrobacillus psychrodurans]